MITTLLFDMGNTLIDFHKGPSDSEKYEIGLRAMVPVLSKRNHRGRRGILKCQIFFFSLNRFAFAMALIFQSTGKHRVLLCVTPWSHLLLFVFSGYKWDSVFVV